MYGGCGRWHEFLINNNAEHYFIEFIWEINECEKFSFWLEKDVRKEWDEEIKCLYLKMVVGKEPPPPTKLGKEGVSIKDTQWEKEFGAGV